ncbi:MAG: phosphate ABC transporter ATP-binding protein [Candidatus Aminicenantes bacterium]|nr:phosphate ABC transporter ATP-binding protein [Candidatus Aminicenantes bacterium]
MEREIVIRVRDFSYYLGSQPILKKITLDVFRHEILSIIGPAGSGKSSFLRCLNRLNEIRAEARISGTIEINGHNIYSPEVSLTELRRKVGMVFALPVPLPRSIFENVAFGLRMAGIKDKKLIEERVIDSLKKVALWDEVKERLNSSALKLSGGQQQRLCIARVLAMRPEFILLDEPCSGLDPVSTMKIEESLMDLKKEYTIILVTNNTKQAARVSDRTAFFLSGELIEIDRTDRIFTAPQDKRTNDYISGRFG